MERSPIIAVLDERAGTRHCPTPLGAAEFRRAFESYGSSIFRFAASRVGPVEAEDVVAEVFVTAWRIRATYSPERGSGVEAWLIGVASKVIARHRHAERRWAKSRKEAARTLEMTSDDGIDAADERLSDAAEHARILAALMHIPSREREPLLLHVINDMSYESISAALDIPIGTVRSRISRGRSRLYERIANEEQP
jgi:RNA polymerase sigma-70 factor (ECF subfamily)